MSLQLMKERMNVSGTSFRSEAIRDAVILEEAENENDPSYCPAFYKVSSHSDYKDQKNYRQIHPRLYDRKWPSCGVHTMKMKTLLKEPVSYGELFYHQKDDTYWLCIQCDCVDDIHYISRLVQCNYHMYWQKNDGSIVSRHVWVRQADACGGKTGGNGTCIDTPWGAQAEPSAITLPSSRYMVYMPLDEETEELEHGKRIHLSNSLSRCRPYDVTRPDDLTCHYGGKGLLHLVFTQTQMNSAEDQLVRLADGTQVWICNYRKADDQNLSSVLSPSPEPAPLHAAISGRQHLKVGLPRTYTVSFSEEDGTEVDWKNVAFRWHVISDFSEKFIWEDQGNQIQLVLNDEGLAGSTFLLQILTSDTVMSEMEITVLDEF